MIWLGRLLAIALLVSSLPAWGVAAERVEAGGDEAVAEPPSEGRRLDRAADFPPVGVTLGYTHERGDWTFSYRYVRQQKDGLLVGDREPSAAEFQARGYTTLPHSQQANIHTLGVMYAPRDRLTFALMLPYVERRLEFEQNGERRTTTSAGIGDAKLIFLVPFIRKGGESTHLNLGISFPTGSIRETDASGDRLPYVMQLGSGSWDAHWGITYNGQARWLSWGGQFEGLYRMTINDLDYRLGTVYRASAWWAASPGAWLSASFRLGWKKTGNVHGGDPALQATQGENPLNDGMLQGGTVIDVGPGLNLLLPVFGGQRLALEASWPVYQYLDGPQLADQVTFTASWQWIY